MSRKLAVFDFDYTIVDDNSDTYIRDLLHKDMIPVAIKKLYKKDGWTAYMQGIFKVLYAKGFKEAQILKRLRQIPPTAGMLELLQALKDTGNTDTILISDSNDYFINSWLEHYGVSDCVYKVFTNPAKFVYGRLSIEMYHLQTDCKLSTKNLCKGRILDEFIAKREKQGVLYEDILYAGDGTNDFCPILRLKSGDTACVRKGFKCVALVQDAIAGKPISITGERYEIKANVLLWDSGFDILNSLNCQL